MRWTSTSLAHMADQRALAPRVVNKTKENGTEAENVLATR